MANMSLELVEKLASEKNFDTIQEFASIAHMGQKPVVIREYTGSEIRAFEESGNINILYPEKATAVQESALAKALTTGSIFDDAEEASRGATYVRLTIIPAKAFAKSNPCDLPRAMGTFTKACIGQMDSDGRLPCSQACIENGHNFEKEMLLAKANNVDTNDVIRKHLDIRDEDRIPSFMAKSAWEVKKELDKLREIEDGGSLDVDDYTEIDPHAEAEEEVKAIEEGEKEKDIEKEIDKSFEDVEDESNEEDEEKTKKPADDEESEEGEEDDQEDESDDDLDDDDDNDDEVVEEACKDVESARELTQKVRELAEGYDANFYFVTDGASAIHNEGNPAVKTAREAVAAWERENGFDDKEDWSKDSPEVIEEMVVSSAKNIRKKTLKAFKAAHADLDKLIKLESDGRLTRGRIISMYKSTKSSYTTYVATDYYGFGYPVEYDIKSPAMAAIVMCDQFCKAINKKKKYRKMFTEEELGIVEDISSNINEFVEDINAVINSEDGADRLVKNIVKNAKVIIHGMTSLEKESTSARSMKLNETGNNDEVVEEAFFSLRPKKLKDLRARETVAYITVEMGAIRDSNDQAMLSGYTCSKLELCDFYINCLDTQDARYVVPHNRAYLVQFQTDLNRLLTQILAIKPINKQDRVWKVGVNYPEGWRG